MLHRARAFESLEVRQLLAAATMSSALSSTGSESPAVVAAGSSSEGALAGSAAAGGSGASGAGAAAVADSTSTPADTTPGDGTAEYIAPPGPWPTGASDSPAEHAANANTAMSDANSAGGAGSGMSYAYQNDNGMGYTNSKNSAYGSNYYDNDQAPNSRPANTPLPLLTPSPLVQTPANPQPVNVAGADAAPVGAAAASQVARSDNSLAPRGPSEIDVGAASAPQASSDLAPAVWVADLEPGVATAPRDRSWEPDMQFAPVETEATRWPKKGEVLAGAVAFDLSCLDAGVEEFLGELDKLADEVVNAITADRVAHWMIITAGAAAAFEFARNGTRPPAAGEPALVEGWREQIRRRLCRPLRGREVPP